MQKQEEKSQFYGVWILRSDNEHITALETDKYDKAHELWLKLSDTWEDAVKNNKPFRLTAPVVTAFSPSLIVEITIRPLTASAEESKYQNPYQQAMRKQGLSNMLNGGSNVANPDLLDGGYR